MFKILLISVILLTSSCATGKAKYKDVNISLKNMTWRFCSADRDGEFAQKGLCYWHKECKSRFLRPKKCRRKLLHCSWGDVACMNKWKILEKTINNR